MIATGYMMQLQLRLQLNAPAKAYPTLTIHSNPQVSLSFPRHCSVVLYTHYRVT